MSLDMSEVMNTKDTKCDIKSIKSEEIGTVSGVFKLTTPLIGYKAVKCYSEFNYSRYYTLAKISIPVGAIIVVPHYYAIPSKISNDLRTDTIKIEEIWKQNESDECFNYYYNQCLYTKNYKVGETYNSELNTTILDFSCEEGFHFMLSKELLIKHNY